MENNLKIGDSFEVVEVLQYGFTDKTLFKLGGWTVSKEDYFSIYTCLINGLNENVYFSKFLNMRLGEVKPVGKLTITKLK